MHMLFHTIFIADSYHTLFWSSSNISDFTVFYFIYLLYTITSIGLLHCVVYK